MLFLILHIRILKPNHFDKMKIDRSITVVLLLAVSIFVAGHEQLFSGPSRPVLIKLVKSWAYQIQGLEYEEAVDKLVRLNVDMVVVEPMTTMTDFNDFDAMGMIEKLKDSVSTDPKYRKLVLAYVDIGQAEEWRTYFRNDWRPPTRLRPGWPDLMVGEDPDGWSGNYPVAFWDTRWKGIVVNGERSILGEVLDLGFDGIYMDWVEAYDDEGVISRAKVEGKDPAEEMVTFIGEIRKYARKRNPDFLIVPQNAPYLIEELIEEADGYLDVIDAIAQEDLSFSGGGDTDWDDPESGDIKTPRGSYEWCREDLARVLTKYLKAGKPVFTVDYCLKPENIKEAREYSLSKGFVPFVSRTPLDRLP